MSTSGHPPNHILILGGGTAGWMAAILFAHAWAHKGVKITLMESSTIGTIGVGEGSTPKMRRFFEDLGIPESEWMPACNATYKCGIRFPGWSTRPGYTSYYHPFFTLSDKDFVQSFFHNVELRRKKNIKVHAHPNAFFVSHYLSSRNYAPVAQAASDYQTDYAYHFDAGKIGEFLKEKCLALGVKHLIDTVTNVNRSENGDIASLETGEHGSVVADFFVDCTGFASLLIGKTLEVPYHSYSDTLFNDRAVALPTALDKDKLPSQTLSSGLKHGWAWKIPLTNRFGHGYVYSSNYCDEESAEKELREHINQHDESVTARHLKMRIGRVERAWEGNCLAVGLSQGFIEPLEATALMIVQDTLENFIRRLEQDHFTDVNRQVFNEKINLICDGVRDYVFMHYKLNSRADTPYWLDNRNNENTPDFVRELLTTWDKGKDVLGLLQTNSERLVYSHTSWICILAGMGRFPGQPKKVKPNMQHADPKLVKQHCEQRLINFQDHQKTIQSMRTGD